MTAKLRVISLVCLAWLGRPSAAAEPAPYPVWWSPKLELESLDEIDARLDGPFWRDGDGYAVYKGVGDDRIESTINACGMRHVLFEEGYHAEAPERYFEVYLWSMCDALEKLKRAKPARKSFVRSFKFDGYAMDYLPPLVGYPPSCDFLCRLKVANEMGITWTQLKDSVLKQHARENTSMPVSSEVRSIQVEDDKTATILIEHVEEVPIEAERTTVWSYSVDRNRLEILAYGDFNNDGLDDMLMRLQGAPRVFVLTRDSPDDVFYVLNAQEHLCADYHECDEAYDYPEVLRDVEAQ